jgi:hypothetical protein
VSFGFSSAYDDSSMALESLELMSLSPIASLWWRANTGPDFYLCFSFRTITGGAFPHASLHSQNLSTIPNPLKILITFDCKPRVCTYAFFAWMALYLSHWIGQ